MRTVQISACQFPVERMSSFDDFRRRVEGFLEQVPRDSHYVIFPELFTVGLLTTYPNADRLAAANLTRIDEFTDEYKRLFRQAARVRGQFIVAGSHLERHGVRVEAGPLRRGGAKGIGTSVYFRDPDGSLLELISYG